VQGTLRLIVAQRRQGKGVTVNPRSDRLAPEQVIGLRAEWVSKVSGIRTVATLAVRNRVSRRDTTELLREFFGAQFSTGSIDAIVQHAGEALAEPHAQLAEQIRCAAAVNIDETGWRLRGGKRTLWGVLTARQALFRIAPDRHRREAQALLGEDFSGIACSDRWWAYDYLDPERRQLCWAHLVRDFTAHSEGLGAQKVFGAAGLEIAGRLFTVGGVSLPSSDCSRPRSPAVCRGARSLPTSATSLPPGSAAIPSPRSPDSAET
jgi:hypothetical protein